MNGVEMPSALPWLVVAACWLVLCPVAVAIYSALRMPLVRLDPAQRSTLLLGLALLPPLVGAIVTVLCFAPVVGGVLVAPHCHAAADCAAHVPILHTTHATLFGAVLFVVSGSLLWVLIERLRRSVALANTLAGLAAVTDRAQFRIVESDERFAYCVGFARPELLVSRGLLNGLSTPQVDAVVAHEREHARRRDNLRNWLASVSLAPVPRGLRRGLLSELAGASEQSCDRIAAAACGPAVVIETLSTLASTQNRRRSITPIAERILALAAPPPVKLPAVVVPAMIFGLYALLALPLVDAAHYGAEVVLRWLG